MILPSSSFRVQTELIQVFFPGGRRRCPSEPTSKHAPAPASTALGIRPEEAPELPAPELPETLPATPPGDTPDSPLSPMIYFSLPLYSGRAAVGFVQNRE